MQRRARLGRPRGPRDLEDARRAGPETRGRAGGRAPARGTEIQQRTPRPRPPRSCARRATTCPRCLAPIPARTWCSAVRRRRRRLERDGGRRRRSAGRRRPTADAHGRRAIPAPEGTEQHPCPRESVAAPDAHARRGAAAARAAARAPPGLALDDFVASERTAAETPVEPMEPRRSVEGAAPGAGRRRVGGPGGAGAALAQRSAARAPRSSVAGAPLALGDVDHAATYSSDDEARPAPTDKPTYADDDAAFGSVMDAFAEAANKAEADRQAAAARRRRGGERPRPRNSARRSRRGGRACGRGGCCAALAAEVEAGDRERSRGQGPRGGGRRGRARRAGGG